MTENDLQQLNSEVDSESAPQSQSALSPKRKKFNRVVDVLLWVVIALLVAAVLTRAFVFTQITVSGESMMDTLLDKDVVGVSKVKKPQRGDVVVFYKNDVKNKFGDIFASRQTGDGDEFAKLIKRVVATSGDRLWVERVDNLTDTYRVIVQTADGKRLVENYYQKDGVTIDEDAFYIKGTLATGSDLGQLRSHVGEENALIIDDGCIFAMGDNRSNSSDSRAFGQVPLSRIYGVVIDR